MLEIAGIFVITVPLAFYAVLWFVSRGEAGASWRTHRGPDQLELVTTKGSAFRRVERRIGDTSRVRVWYSYPDGVPVSPTKAKWLERELEALYVSEMGELLSRQWQLEAALVEAVEQQCDT